MWVQDKKKGERNTGGEKEGGGESKGGRAAGEMDSGGGENLEQGRRLANSGSDVLLGPAFSDF